MCIISGNGSGGGGHTPTITAKGRAGRGHMKGSMGGSRRNYERTILPQIVGHAFADVLRGRMSLGDWWRFETDLSQHQADCRYVRLVRTLRAG